MNLTERFQRSFYFHIKTKHVPVFWHDCGGILNFGDELNSFIIKSLTGKNIERVKFIPRRLASKKVNLCIGSIISGANKNCNVWGSGIISSTSKINCSNFYAVRGPRTQDRMKQLGIIPPLTIGDPALLTPLFYDIPQKKIYEIGIIPHYTEFDILKLQKWPNWISLIDVTSPVLEVVNEIRKCNYILSSSLHGIIVSHAYNISAAWIKLSNDRIIGDNVKYHDYFESVGIYNHKSVEYKPDTLTCSMIDKFEFVIPDTNLIKQIQSNLIQINPFII